MNDKQKKSLLKIARSAIQATINEWTPPTPIAKDPELNTKCGCFVTLTNAGQLRGCIGQFTSKKPVAELVSEMAIAATVNDRRFISNPITADELEDLEIEISVLSPLKKTDNPASLRLGIDGVYITQGHKSGCFLPQVARETGWTEEQFLTHCCVEKAQLPADAWRDPGTQVYFFSADAFGARFADI